MAGVGAERPILILLGSARSDGETASAVNMLVQRLSPGDCEVIDLQSKNIQPFGYLDPAPQDDFAGVIAAMLKHRSLVFSTPVYWYSMSGVLKTFLDRFTDILSGRDPAQRGRQLAGRQVWLLATGSDPDLPNGFEVPFQRTSDYFQMSWRGSCYLRSGAPDQLALDAFAQALRTGCGSH